MAKFGFIGMGNMGSAIMRGLLKVCAPSELLFTDASKERREAVTAETGVAHVDSNADCVRRSKYVVLAVKPQVISHVFEDIRGELSSDQIVISIVAGYATEDLKAGLGDSVRIVRSMPNTPAMVGEGMTGVCYDDALFSDEEKETIHQFFGSFGKMERVGERQRLFSGLRLYVYRSVGRRMREKRSSPPDGIPDGGSGSAGKRKDGSGDGKASGRIEGYGLLAGRNDHRGLGGAGGMRIPRRDHQGLRRQL